MSSEKNRWKISGRALLRRDVFFKTSFRHTSMLPLCRFLLGGLKGAVESKVKVHARVIVSHKPRLVPLMQSLRTRTHKINVLLYVFDLNENGADLHTQRSLNLYLPIKQTVDIRASAQLDV